MIKEEMKKLIKDLDYMFFCFIVIFFLTAFILSFVFLKNDSEEWVEFKNKNNCKIVSYVKSETKIVPTISANGSASVGYLMPNLKTGWLCDDGITYYR